MPPDTYCSISMHSPPPHNRERHHVAQQISAQNMSASHGQKQEDQPKPPSPPQQRSAASSARRPQWRAQPATPAWCVDRGGAPLCASSMCPSLFVCHFHQSIAFENSLRVAAIVVFGGFAGATALLPELVGVSLRPYLILPGNPVVLSIRRAVNIRRCRQVRVVHHLVRVLRKSVRLRQINQRLRMLLPAATSAGDSILRKLQRHECTPQPPSDLPASSAPHNPASRHIHSSSPQKKCPSGAFRNRSVWKFPAGRYPRCTIIPAPLPTREWQGVQ